MGLPYQHIVKALSLIKVLKKKKVKALLKSWLKTL